MPRVAEEEESGDSRDSKEREGRQGRLSPPSLPPAPLFLTAEQTKRRHIICSLVHSENNYLASLDRLVGEYKLPLEQSSPPILSQAKVETLFYRLEQILASHLQFRGALTEAVQSWDQVRGRTAAVGCLGLIRLFSGGENRRRLRELFFQV